MFRCRVRNSIKLLIILGECFHYWTSCQTFKGDKTCCRPTAVSTSTCDVVTSGQGYSSLELAQSSTFCDWNCLYYRWHSKSPRSPRNCENPFREADIRACRPYIGPPLTQERRVRRISWLMAHETVPMRQRRRVLFTAESRPNGRWQFNSSKVQGWSPSLCCSPSSAATSIDFTAK